MPTRQAVWLKTSKGKSYAKSYTKSYRQGFRRRWKGCDVCKQEKATELFNGVMGHKVWICLDCFKSFL